VKPAGSITFSGLRFECGKQEGVHSKDVWGTVLANPEGVQSKEVWGTVLANPEITLPSPVSCIYLWIRVATKSLSFTFTARYVSNRFFGMGAIIKPNGECIQQYSQSSLISCASSPQQDPEMLGHYSNKDVIMFEGPTLVFQNSQCLQPVAFW
jgi:hypothetical protein